MGARRRPAWLKAARVAEGSPVAEERTRPRWGILGGIFDPIHYGHLAIAEQTRDALDLAGVLFIPAGQPVHRDAPMATPADRLRMVGLAVADNPTFVVSATEVEAARPSYSVQTLEELTAQQPNDDFILILSAESAHSLPSWRDPVRLIELAEIAIVPRLGYDELSRDWIDDVFPGRQDRFTFVETTHLGHSASDVRARVAAGKSIRYLVPPAVEAYITEHDLYQSKETDGTH
jgi:nicotinate-nucleotide adenylyltransferase